MNLLKKLFCVDRAANLPKALTGFCVLFLVLSAASCSRAPEDPAWFQSTTSGDTLTSAQLGERINRTDSLFDLFDMKREYILRGGDSEKIMIALDKRRDQLTEEAEAFPAIPDKLDFLGWDIKKLEENKYRISCYFVVTGKMDRDWILKIISTVDEKHAHLLPPDNQKSKRIAWKVYPKTSTWDPGEHKILSEIVELQPIPYNIFARFFLYPEKINHDVFHYGWFADPDVGPIPEDKPAPH
jgi:hypothetical protein